MARRNELAQQASSRNWLLVGSIPWCSCHAVNILTTNHLQPSTMQQLAGLGIAGLGAYNYFN